MPVAAKLLNNDESFLTRVTAGQSLVSIRVKLFFLFVVIRIVFAAFQRTYHTPDEVWQGPEVAHNLVFGIGNPTWEWKQDIKLRGFTHPMLYAIPYYMLSCFSLDTDWLITYSPRIIQSFLAALGDVAFYESSRILFGTSSAISATTLHLVNHVFALSLSRTTSNATATSLSLIGILALLEHRTVAMAVFAALTVIIRQTAVVFWVPVCLSVVFKQSPKKTIACILAGLAVLGGGVFLDTYLYGSRDLVFVPWNFVHFNLVLDVAKEYGVTPWHHYVFYIIPRMFLTALPAWLAGLNKMPRLLLACSVLEGLVLNLSAHKEGRFLWPALAILSLASGEGISRLWSYVGDRRGIMGVRFSRRLVIFALIVLPHAALLTYKSRWQQEHPDLALAEVRREFRDWSIQHKNFRALFLTACHAVPEYSHAHSLGMAAGYLDMLDCSPRVVRGPVPSDRDLFYQDPVSFVQNNSARVQKANMLIVTSEKMTSELQKILKGMEFELYSSPSVPALSNSRIMTPSKGFYFFRKEIIP